MISNTRQLIWKDHKAIRPSAVFVMLAVALAVAVHFVAMAVFESSFLPVGLFALIGAVALHGLVDTYPHKSLGLCNGVTLTRAALASVLLGAVFAPEFDRWIVFAIASAAFAMDGLDGWLARRTGLTSTFGARFDMEVDAVLSALLAVILVSSGRAGPEVLLLGFLRYGFVGLSFLVPKLQAELPPSFRRKAVCVIQIATLLLLVCPVTPAAFLAPATIGAVILLLWSFAIDIYWLLRVAK